MAIESALQACSQYLGENASLAVEDFGALALRRLVPRRDLIEEVRGIGLVAASLVCTGRRQRRLGVCQRCFDLL